MSNLWNQHTACMFCIICMVKFLWLISWFFLWSWSVSWCIIDYLEQAPKLLCPNEILTQYQYKQNSWMESRMFFASINYDLFYFRTWKCLALLAERYLQLMYTFFGQEIASSEYKYKRKDFFYVHKMLSVYRYRSVLTFLMKCILLLSILLWRIQTKGQ